jgi:proteasome assembly chaperone (PAC2) family protein
VSEIEGVVFEQRPVLRKPYIVCGINGWVNGGDVSVGGVRHLIKQFHGVKFAALKTSRYHVYQVPGAENLRPVFKMQDGIILEYHLPKDEFYYALNPDSDHDLILFIGTEPSLNWEEYSAAVVGVAMGFGSPRLYTFGGILDRSPYTREPRISCACTNTRVKSEIERCNVTFSSREGPATFNQMLLHACMERGLDGANFTVRVSYYPEFNVAVEYSPKSIRAVLVRLNHLMHLGLKFQELDEGIKELEGKLDFVRQQNPQFNTYVEELEKDYVEMPFEPLDMSANDAVRFAEQLLKENNDQRHGQ